MSRAPWLVTGANGFLGRHVLELLSRRRPEVRTLALVRKKADWPKEEWTGALRGVTPIEGGVVQPDGWTHDPSLSGLGGIFHFAALVRHNRRNPEPLFETNVEGTIRMVRLAAERRCRMIYISTSGTVGVSDNPDDAPDETAPYRDEIATLWPYYASKIEAEKKVRALAADLGVELVVIRPPVMLGPGDHRFRSTSLVIKHLTRRLPFIVDGGMHFIDIRDASAAIVAAMEHPNPKPVYHLPGTACRVDEFFDLCEQVSGVPAPRRRLPYEVAHAAAIAAESASHLFGRDHSPLPDPVVVEMGCKYWGLKSLYAAQDLRFNNRSPLQTMADTVDWLRQHHPDLKAEDTSGARTAA